MFFILSSLLLFISCQEEEYEVKYSVISGINDLSARIIFKDAKKSDQVLLNENLPWNYNFNGKEGDSIKVSANVYSDGNSAIIGTDTLKVIIFINGVKYKENFGIITNSSSDVVTVSGIIQ
jgi:hypothetical protein